MRNLHLMLGGGLLLSLCLAACGTIAPAPTNSPAGLSTPPNHPDVNTAILLASCLRKVTLQVKPSGIVPVKTPIVLSAIVTKTASCPSPSYDFSVTTNGITNPVAIWSNSPQATYRPATPTAQLYFTVTVGIPSIPLVQINSPDLKVVLPPPPPVHKATPTSPPPPPPSFTPPSPPRTVLISNVPHVYQTDTSEYCEAAALDMVLRHEGIDVSVSTVIANENVQYPTRVYSEYGQEVSNGDPYTSFVGNPYGTGNTPSTYGYGTYYPNIARDARSLGGDVLWAGTGLSLDSLYAYIKAGHPAIAWVDDNNSCVLQNGGGLFYVTAYNGVSVPYALYGNEHALVVAGVSSNSVYILNPLPCGYSGWISKSAFANTFASFDNMAVVVS